VGRRATAFAGLDTQGLLLKGFEPSVAWNSLGAASVPADKSYVPTGSRSWASSPTTKTKVANPPSTWQALCVVAWKGQGRHETPVQSGPTFPLIAGVITTSAASRPARSTSPPSSPTPDHPPDQRPDAAGADLRSDQPGAGAELAAIGATFTDKKHRHQVPRPRHPLPSALGIDAKGAGRRAGRGREVIELRAVGAGQKVMQSGDPTGDSLYYPVINGVSPLPALPSLASVKTQTINPYTWGPQERPSTPGSTRTSSVND